MNVIEGQNELHCYCFLFGGEEREEKGILFSTSFYLPGGSPCQVIVSPSSRFDTKVYR